MRWSPATSRTSPTKLVTPPMFVLPRVRAASSAPTSKSSRCTRITGSASRHRRDQRHLVARRHRMVAGDIALVDGNAHDARVLERLGEARSAALEPVEQRRHGGDPGGQLDPFLGGADLGAQPGEIEQLHATRPMAFTLWFQLPNSRRQDMQPPTSVVPAESGDPGRATARGPTGATASTSSRAGAWRDLYDDLPF